MAITTKNIVLKNKDWILKRLIPTKVDCWISIKGKEAINKALAGVGKPIKTSVCLLSLLNLANRNAENKGIKKARNGTTDIKPVFTEIPLEYSISLNKINPGTKPNDTISARESRSFPMGLCTFKSLAKKPSRKSKIAANPIK